MNVFQRTKLTVIVLGIAQVVLGVMMFMNPAGATISLARLVGWVLVFVGGVTIGSNLMRAGEAVDYVVGGLELLLGIIMVVRPAFFVTYLFVILGIMVIITGINDIIDAGRVRADGTKISTGMGILTLIMGVAMLVTPFFFADLLVWVAGIALIVSGVTEVISGLKME